MFNPIFWDCKSTINLFTNKRMAIIFEYTFFLLKSHNFSSDKFQTKNNFNSLSNSSKYLIEIRP